MCIQVRKKYKKFTHTHDENVRMNRFMLRMHVRVYLCICVIQSIEMNEVATCETSNASFLLEFIHAVALLFGSVDVTVQTTRRHTCGILSRPIHVWLMQQPHHMQLHFISFIYIRCEIMCIFQVLWLSYLSLESTNKVWKKVKWNEQLFFWL